MKILIVASFADSVINFRGSLILAMLSKGIKVHVAAFNLKVGHPVRTSLEALGVMAYDIPISRTGMNPVADLRTMLEIYYLVLQVKPDITLCYTIKPVIYGTLAAWLAGVPNRIALITGLGYAFTGGGIGLRGIISFIAKRFYKLALRRAHKVFFQNPDDQAFFYQLKLLPNTVQSFVVNGSGVDIDYFSVQDLPLVPLRFLLIARLQGDKGVREYVKAASKVRERYPEVRFMLVGWIDENPNAITQSELDDWTSDGTVEFLGRLSDVRTAIEQCSVYVLPSYREGTPRTVLEAMAMGRPIITTNAPGCRETVVDGDNGFLVPVQSAEDLMLAMLRFINEPRLVYRMGQRSRQLAKEKYDVHKVNAVMLREMEL